MKAKPRYIQDEEWWKEIERREDEKIRKESRQYMDKAILKAFSIK